MSNAQDLYNSIKSDRLDPENALVIRNVGGGDASAANQTALNALITTLLTQLPATLGVKTQVLALSVNVAQDKNTWAQLTAPGVTPAFSMVGYKRATVAVTIATINTNVVIRIEGSLDGTNWFNLSATDTDTTFTANGTYGFNVEAAVDNIRLNFVSEAGGTTATVNGTVRVSA